jgi:hypothetical protein
MKFASTFFLANVLALTSAAAVPVEGDSQGVTVVPNVPFTNTPSNSSVASIAAAQSFFQAFSGSTCDGDAGNQIFFDSVSRCIDATNRHSYIIGGTPAPHGYLVDLFTDPGCTGTLIEFPSNFGSCVNVNTGRSWRSVRVKLQ